MIAGMKVTAVSKGIGGWFHIKLTDEQNNDVTIMTKESGAFYPLVRSFVDDVVTVEIGAVEVIAGNVRRLEVA